MGKTRSKGAPYSKQRTIASRGPLRLSLAGLILLALLGVFRPLPGPARAAPRQAPATALQLLASPSVPLVGETVTLDLQVYDVPALAGVGLYLQFDPSRLRVVEASPGAPVAAGGFFTPTTVALNQVDGAAGLVAYAAARGSAPYPSGSGSLIRVTFQALASGNTDIRLLPAETALISPDGLVLPYTSVDATIPVLPRAICCERIVNGSFEPSSLAGWQASPLTIVYDKISHTGLASAWLGGYNNANDQLSQTLVLSPRTVRATFQYWYQVQSTAVGAGADRLEVELLDQAGNVLTVLDQRSDADADWAWHQSPAVDLSRYAGQTVRVHFHATTDATQETDFFIDDVALMACSAASGKPVHLPIILAAPASVGP